MDGTDIFSLLAMMMHFAFSPVVIIGVIGVGELIVVLRFACKRGATLHRSNDRSLRPLIGVGMFLVFIAYLFRRHDNTLTAAVIVVVCSLCMVPFGLRSAFRGVYEHMVVSKDFICGWDKIERYEIEPGVLRLTHRTKGAAEFAMTPTKLRSVGTGVARILEQYDTETPEQRLP